MYTPFVRTQKYHQIYYLYKLKNITKYTVHSEFSAALPHFPHSITGSCYRQDKTKIATDAIDFFHANNDAKNSIRNLLRVILISDIVF